MTDLHGKRNLWLVRKCIEDTCPFQGIICGICIIINENVTYWHVYSKPFSSSFLFEIWILENLTCFLFGVVYLLIFILKFVHCDGDHFECLKSISNGPRILWVTILWRRIELYLMMKVEKRIWKEAADGSLNFRSTPQKELKDLRAPKRKCLP